MSWQSELRSLRYLKPSSLSTINSNEEAQYHTSERTLIAPISPYLGGASDRNSVVSPLPQQEHFERSARNTDEERATFYTISDPVKPTFDLQRLSQFVDKSEHKKHKMFGRDLENSHGPDESAPKTIIQKPYTKYSDEVDAENFLKTKWMWMLLQLDQIPITHNILAGFCTWVILAAYLVLPGTFTTLQASNAFNPPEGKPDSQLDNIAHAISSGVRHLGLAVASAIFASLGAFGCFFLWFVHWKNYLWLCNKIFLPVMLNSFAGLLSTIISVETANKGVWSFTATINAIVSGSVAGISCLVYCFYYFHLLKKVKEDHHKQFPNEKDLYKLTGRRIGHVRRWFGSRK